MDRDHDPLFHAASKGIDPQAAAELFAAMDELKAVIDGENEVLALGLPNTTLELKARKAALQAKCTALLLEVSEDVRALAMDQGVLDQLATVTADMRRLTSENAKLLDETAKASRRRIDAVMQAIQTASDEN
ncbi:hypothetical protein GALL_242290 [mine drainage metagenome]|uniref:Uncharacterized protein n=1 Tax=mine drainage metagenome TaxID=410659 RepID=A0A1J5RCM7_9ZZZZ